MSKTIFVAASLFLASTASYADNCEEIRGQIDAKIKASGVSQYVLLVADNAATAPGKVVGSCARGAKKILYAQIAPSTGSAATGPAAATAIPAAPSPSISKTKAATNAMLTECKDGSAPVRGSCKK